MHSSHRGTEGTNMPGKGEAKGACKRPERSGRGRRERAQQITCAKGGMEATQGHGRRKANPNTRRGTDMAGQGVAREHVVQKAKSNPVEVGHGTRKRRAT